MPIYLSEADVVTLLPMADAISAVETGLRELGLGQAQNEPRQRVNIGSTVLNVMPAAIPALGVLGVKSYTSTPEGPRGYFLLFAASGELLCLMEADELGRIRTGATTGVATRCLARPGVREAALLGVGFQAETQLLALCTALPLSRVRVWGRRPEALAAFCARMQPRVAAELLPVSDPRTAVSGAGVVTTVTSAKMPVLAGAWLEPGTHVNAVGNNRAHEREIDAATVAAAAAIYADSVAQAQLESGDLLLAAAEGVPVWERIGALPALVAGLAQGRTAPEHITLFKSNGLAVEDVAAAHAVYTAALQQGAGRNLPV